MINEYYIVWDDELKHHGVKGMKWGVRRRIDAARGSAQLNKIDKRKAEETSNYIRADIKSRSYAEKISKYKNTDRADRFIQKKAAVDVKRKQHLANIKKAESETNKLIEQFKKNKYTVTSKEIVRQTKAGEQFASMYFGGIIGYASITSVKASRAGDRYKTSLGDNRQFNQNEYQVKGKRYKLGS